MHAFVRFNNSLVQIKFPQGGDVIPRISTVLYQKNCSQLQTPTLIYKMLKYFVLNYKKLV